MAQVVRYICGFETGDFSEVSSGTAGAAVQISVVRTGAYAFQAGTAATLLQAASTLAATQSVIRFYLQVPSLPGAATVFMIERTGGTVRARVRFNASNNLEVIDGGAGPLGLATTAGTATFNVNQWYRIEFAIDLAAGGVVKVWVDGVLDINTTHTTDATASPTGNYSIQSPASPNQYFFDDIRIDTGGVSPIGAGQCIARQGKAGTPTYDTWTKTGAATAALCWSDTPFNATKNCNSAVSAAKQTMLVEKFSITQTGHGSQVVGASDTVNAVKTAMIVKTVSGDATGQILRRVNGTDTGAVFTDTAADVYHDDGIWTTTAANLDLLEAGLIHGNNTRVTTVEDVWVIVDYTPAGGSVSGTVAETGTAASTQSALLGMKATVAETGAALDTATAKLGLKATIAESGAAIDALSAFLGMRAVIAETGAALDHVSAIATFAVSASIAETGHAVDSWTATALSPSSINYGVTGGPGMSVYQGLQHSNAHGVGGQQRGLSGLEGIPGDAPQ